MEDGQTALLRDSGWVGVVCKVHSDYNVISQGQAAPRELTPSSSSCTFSAPAFTGRAGSVFHSLLLPLKNPPVLPQLVGPLQYYVIAGRQDSATAFHRSAAARQRVYSIKGNAVEIQRLVVFELEGVLNARFEVKSRLLAESEHALPSSCCGGDKAVTSAAERL
ncbi:hypothetical protein AOLI_G00024120 [Acnodon oligacanthus]